MKKKPTTRLTEEELFARRLASLLIEQVKNNKSNRFYEQRPKLEQNA